ncbi:hypothetical protein ACIA98_02360 [Streptomyces sp. NPDC051366]|uniref:hypothetical protein n=1 Tax=Streptomyces sp. NPDC051366 TaxID=3365652 RepID=UPI0037AFA3A3
MSHVSRTLRLALLTASTTLAAGGVLLPTGALAAPATPHTTTLPADRDSHGHKDRSGEDRNNDQGGSDENPADEGKDSSEPTDSESGVVSQDYCNSPNAAPGLCVDGKPLPKGDGTVKVPQGKIPCLAIDSPELCAQKQNPKPYVPSPTGSSTVGLAV